MHRNLSSIGEGRRWLVPVRRTAAARLRLFCFPHAGGGPSGFLRWGDALPGDVDVLAVQPPGRESRVADRPFTRIEPLVEAAACALSPWLDQPFVFFGHSLGGLIAFETARALRRMGAPGLLHLVVSAHRGPQVPLSRLPVFDRSDAELIKSIRRLCGTSDALLRDLELLKVFLPLLRADFEVDETYQCCHADRLTCPITAFGGIDDPWVNVPQLQAWAEQTTTAFGLRLFAGGHFYIQTQRESVLRALSTILEDPSTSRSSRGILSDAATTAGDGRQQASRCPTGT